MTMATLPTVDDDDGQESHPGPSAATLMRNRVKSGARFLTIHDPEWLRRAQELPPNHPAKRDTLYMNVVGSYETWVALERNRTLHWLIWRGFFPDPEGTYGDAYNGDALSAAWRDYIDAHTSKGRRAPQA